MSLINDKSYDLVLAVIGVAGTPANIGGVLQAKLAKPENEYDLALIATTSADTMSAVVAMAHMAELIKWSAKTVGRLGVAAAAADLAVKIQIAYVDFYTPGPMHKTLSNSTIISLASSFSGLVASGAGLVAIGGVGAGPLLAIAGVAAVGSVALGFLAITANGDGNGIYTDTVAPVIEQSKAFLDSLNGSAAEFLDSLDTLPAYLADADFVPDAVQIFEPSLPVDASRGVAYEIAREAVLRAAENHEDGPVHYTDMATNVTIDGAGPSDKRITFMADGGGAVNGTGYVDQIFGGDGNDVIRGGDGDDRIEGWKGSDEIRGGAGDDDLRAEYGHDTLIGDEGDDHLWSLDGGHVLLGGIGDDTYHANFGDVITDTDGIGKVKLGDKWLTGGTWNSELNAWVGANGIIYTQVGNKLLIKDMAYPTEAPLVINEFALNQFGKEHGSLNINLDGSSIYEKFAIPLRAGIATAQFTPSRRLTDPLVLDLNGDGSIDTVGTTATTTPTTAGVYFDHAADGFAENTGWVGSADGLLVRDLNGNGTIDSGRELFGDQTLLANGALATNGFTALAGLDSNLDGKVDAADAGFSELRVWQDADSDGLTDAGELHTLAELGIVSLNTGYTSPNTNLGNGNILAQAGTYLKEDGSVGNSGSLLFDRNSTDSIATEWLTVPLAVQALPDLAMAGAVAVGRAALGFLATRITQSLAIPLYSN